MYSYRQHRLSATQRKLLEVCDRHYRTPQELQQRSQLRIHPASTQAALRFLADLGFLEKHPRRIPSRYRLAAPVLGLPSKS